MPARRSDRTMFAVRARADFNSRRLHLLSQPDLDPVNPRGPFATHFSLAARLCFSIDKVHRGNRGAYGAAQIHHTCWRGGGGMAAAGAGGAGGAAWGRGAGRTARGIVWAV